MEHAEKMLTAQPDKIFFYKEYTTPTTNHTNTWYLVNGYLYNLIYYREEATTLMQQNYVQF